jgi:hypothetical protein
MNYSAEDKTMRRIQRNTLFLALEQFGFSLNEDMVALCEDIAALKQKRPDLFQFVKREKNVR